MVERQDHDKNQLIVLTMGKTDWVLPKDRISHIMCRNDKLERQCCGSMFSRLDSLVLVLSLVEADALGNHTHLPHIFGQALIANSCPFGDFKGPVSKS